MPQDYIITADLQSGEQIDVEFSQGGPGTTGPTGPTGPTGIFGDVEPDDGSIVAGELKIWLDSTPGLSKVMFKARDSNGVIRRGSVDLA